VRSTGGHRAVRRIGKRDDQSTLFTAELVQERGVHADFDQLRIALVIPRVAMTRTSFRLRSDNRGR
jgi:hypothetical protein